MKAHKKIIRIIKHDPRHAHVELLLKQRNSLHLEDLYRQIVLIMLYKVKHDQVYNCFTTMVSRCQKTQGGATT